MYDSRLPSGEICAAARSGLPSSTSSGMSFTSAIAGLLLGVGLKS